MISIRPQRRGRRETAECTKPVASSRTGLDYPNGGNGSRPLPYAHPLTTCLSSTLIHSTTTGSHWFDLDAVCDTFSTLYVNWRPEIFAFTQTIHGCGYNPLDCFVYTNGTDPLETGAKVCLASRIALTLISEQVPAKHQHIRFGLTEPKVDSPCMIPSAAWGLLTRHTTHKEDSAFINLNILKIYEGEHILRDDLLSLQVRSVLSRLISPLTSAQNVFTNGINTLVGSLKTAL